MASAWYQLRVFEVGHCLILHLFTCSCPFLCDIQELLYHGDVPILVLGLSKIHASVNPQGSSRIVNDHHWSIWIIILIYNNIQSSTCGWSRMKSDEVGWSRMKSDEVCLCIQLPLGGTITQRRFLFGDAHVLRPAAKTLLQSSPYFSMFRWLHGSL